MGVSGSSLSALFDRRQQDNSFVPELLGELKVADTICSSALSQKRTREEICEDQLV
jgi:hypothetical protein